MIILTLIILFLLSTDRCCAFEPRFYAHSPSSDPLRLKIFSVLGQADKTINCMGTDEIDVGIGEVNQNGRTPIYFKRTQVHEFLKEQKDKNLLVIWFLKSIMVKESPERNEILDKFKTFVGDMGYKRVLIVGAAASGIYVVYDTEPAKPDK